MLYPKRVRFDPSAKGGTSSEPIESLDPPPRAGEVGLPPHIGPQA